MHYFTKEWYELCQKTSAHFGLVEDKKAETFSEEYFQELYNQKLKERSILEEKIVSSHKVIKGIDIKHNPNSNSDSNDSKTVEECFYQALLHNLEQIKNVLPEEILGRIADLRVFLLGKATRQVKEEVTEFCQENKRIMLRTLEDYQKYYKNALGSLDKSMAEKINFHDCTVADVEQTEKTLTLLLDYSGDFGNITKKMRLDNYVILKQDASLQNSRWLYDELYKINGKYELHVLLQNRDKGLIEGLIDFIVSVGHISFEQ